MDTTPRHPRRLTLALLAITAGVALIGAARMKAVAAEGKPCVRVVLTADSMFVAWEQHACHEAPGDTVTMWRMASRHRHCDGIGQLDTATGVLAFHWGNCADTAFWVSRPPLIPQRTTL